ncbi:hypothetical protein GCM10009785_01640 [Brooklawnia cerclae]|uniref:Minor tail protein n=1 Tax=Brooklawnia cerclae TaxID=349934 RepID=A0ABX0SHN1_9ACTN|nr:hypothetical protein [Brooklawnia cerclae]NIH56242.1 hypothetical protein [Brooklawnia cerclae]
MAEAKDVTITDPAGVAIASSATISIVLDGWDNTPALTAERAERATGDGTFPATIHRSRLQLTARGITTGLGSAAAVDQEGRRLRGMFADLANLGTIEVVERDGRVLTAKVELDGETKVSTHAEFGWLEWEIPLSMPDPFRYGSSRTWRIMPPGADSGLVWPLFSEGDELTWGADARVPAVVANQGRAPAWPVITVVGDFPAGVRLGDGLGAWVAWRRPCLPQTPVVFDFASHSVTVGGADQSWALTERGFWSVPPGGSVSPVLQPLGSGGGYADVEIRDTYL